MSNEKFVYTEEVTGEIVNIPVKLLHHHHDNPRKDLGDLSELTASIKAKGVLQNLTVVPFWFELTGVGCDYPEQQAEMGYLVVIGNRRLEAAKAAGLETLPCIIASMTHAEQVQTMLLENMQRADLTVYEQAQGFQMMMDFGDTIESISEKTGFSSTTVRRRLKMAELDKETLKKVSSERQLSLMDFDRLSQIDDIDQRNACLKEIGTANYDRAIKNALDTQTRKKYEDEWRTVLVDKGLEEIDYSEVFSGKYSSCEKTYVLMGTIAASDYQLAGDEKYFSFNHKTVYFRKDISKEQSEKTLEQQRNEAIKRELRDKLDEVTSRAFSLRHDFIFGMSEAAAKNHIATLIEYDIRKDWEQSAQGGWYMRYIRENFTSHPLNAEDDYNSISKDVDDNPFQSLLRHVYVRWCDNKDLGCIDWNLHYTENKRLICIYNFLTALGYEISDEEKALIDGTHELYVKDTPVAEASVEAGKIDDGEDADDEEDFDIDDDLDDEDIVAALKEKYDSEDSENE